MKNAVTKKENSMVEVPYDGKYGVDWAKEQLEKVNIFAAELVAFAKGEIFFEIRENSSNQKEYMEILKEVGYSQTQADSYINHLGKKKVLDYISNTFGSKIAPKAARHLPNNRTAAADIVRKANTFGKPTERNIRKAKMALGLGSGASSESNAEERINNIRERGIAFSNWMREENGYTEESMISDSTIDMAGISDFNQLSFEAITQNYPGWSAFKRKALLKVHPDHGGSNEMLKLLVDLDTAVKCLYEHIESKERNTTYNELKEEFNNNIYPTMQAATNE